MHRLVLRPLLVVVTLTMLSVALMQSVGRLGLAVLDDLELAVNQWLSAQQVRVTGLSGSWRLLNPVITVERLDFPAGHVAEVTLEFDWLESLVRNRLITRRLSVGEGNVELEPNGAGGWRLRGIAGGGDADLSGLLYHSDQLQVATRLVLREDGDDSATAYTVDYVATNRGGRHRHSMLVTNTPMDASAVGAGYGCEQICEGRFELEAREGLWPLWQEEMRIRAEAQGLEIATSRPGLKNFVLAGLDVSWHRLGRISGGQFSVDLQEIILPDDVALSVALAGRVSGSADTHDGVIDEFRWTHERLDDPEVAGGWELPEMRVRVEESFAELWAGSMDLAVAAEFFEGALAGIELPSRWLRELNLDATAVNVRGRLDWPAWEFGFAATLADLQLDGYKGAPYMRGGAGELIGYRRGAQLSLNGQNMVMQFPLTFRDQWELAYVQGTVQAWFKGGYFGLRGPSVRLRTPTHRAAGGFAITRPSDRREERLTLLIELDDLELSQARTYVPYTLSEGLAQWLSTGPKAGVFGAPRFGYHGHVHSQPGQLTKRVELTSQLSDATVLYHSEWPEVSDLFGKLVIAGSMVRIEVARARSADASFLPGSLVVLGDNATYADVDLLSNVATDRLLDFVRNTPLRDSMSFIVPEWTGAGSLSLTADLHIPLKDEPPDELAVDLEIGMQEADLDMPDLRLAFADLDGRLRYRFPNSLEGSGITGSTFDRPVAISARNESGSMVLRVEGSASHHDILHVLEMDDPGVAEGRVGFLADLFVAPNDDAATRLDISTDLVGASLALPGEFAKAPDVARSLGVSVQFLDDYQIVSFAHAGARGWLHINEQPLRGAIGFNLAPPMLDMQADYLVLTGQVEGFALDAVVPDDGDTSDALLPIKLANLRVGAIDLDDFQVTDAILNGDITADGFAINVASTMVGADFRLDGEQPLVADLHYVALPESEDEDADPLSVSVIPDLPDAQVEVRSLRVGDFDYGRWRFDIVPEDDGVRFANLDADLHGVRVQSEDGVRWSAGENRSHFAGRLEVGDMAEVLPHWDYAASLETESGWLAGELSWQGSPANVDLMRLVGTAEIRAKNGRFVDVESGAGALRIFSLMNFNTIAKRMRGDFSDVTGKGLTFDKLKATMALDEGRIEFVEPLKVTGTGSKFEVGGKVNLVDRTLDNEMVVTLPVNKSLPWYGVYLALANPLAGAGVIVGERVLRKPLEQFSSAKYEIGGTIDEPTVNLVSVFDTSMEKGGSEAVPAEVEPVLEAEHKAAEVSDDQQRSEI